MGADSWSGGLDHGDEPDKNNVELISDDKAR